MSGLDKLLRHVQQELAHPQTTKVADSPIEMTIELTRGEWQQLEKVLRLGKIAAAVSASGEGRP